MTRSLYDRIWRREAGETSPLANIRGLYGSKEWVENLDIVNELGGHNGCVNALSWSRSGRLLASGSDDYHLNIYSYQPDSSNAPFSLNTSVYTGHSGNIFSVAFMPHSNDRTLVTAAGDSQVRIFDIEHSSRNGDNAATSVFSASTRNQHFNQFFGNTRYLSVGNTNARIYRSHADRVKRIVTESSPYLFLTCSEDGEVRQWDLRQPSSAYPKPRGGILYMAHRSGQDHDDSNVPPPLISYKRHRLDLNTISCSSSQPHYIALGGAHLHCFLHDRRMLGRDLSEEKGDPGISPEIGSSYDEDQMSRATRCVRRFAPNGKARTKSRYKGHISACKISDANPNEMIVSWSGDHIYSFDLIRSPDATETNLEPRKSINGKSGPRKRWSSKNRKRKRQNGTSMSSPSSESHRRSRRPDVTHDNGDLAVRVRYGNGEIENIPIPSLLPDRPATQDITPTEMLEQARYSVLTETQRLSLSIAKGLVKLRRALFSLDASVREEAGVSDPFSMAPFKESFSAVLLRASNFLPQMGEVMRTWGYPLNPTEEVVRVQQALRRNRESSYRFIQAAGTLARVLGGEIQTPDIDESSLDLFQYITPAPGEDNTIDRKEQFGYDFLKAIILFIEGGRDSVLSGFKRDSVHRRNRVRFPISESADEGALESVLIPYLRELAEDIPVVNVDVSRFEHDETRMIFASQSDAVFAFANFLKMNFPTEDLLSTNSDDASLKETHSTHRLSLIRFWLLEVARGVLMTTGTGVNFEFVNRAFGGLSTNIEDGSDNEMELERCQDDAEANFEDEPIRNISLTRNGNSLNSRAWNTEGEIGVRSHVADIDDESEFNGADDADHDEESTENGGDLDEFSLTVDDSSDSEAQDEEDDDFDDFDDDADSDFAEQIFRDYGFQRSKREEVEDDVPCSSHTRVYRGHCNIKTVKDTNYFGLNDEYVVSGSDSGHLFIWERDTCKLVNILKGDDEVVNVVQGHPYEPTIAASGIDYTVKIFSPDQRAQEDARNGINILDPSNPANAVGPGYGGLKSCKCIHDSYRIMSENDVQRQGGLSDASLTRHMLAQFAASVRDQRGGLVPGEHARIVLDESCSVM